MNKKSILSNIPYEMRVGCAGWLIGATMLPATYIGLKHFADIRYAADSHDYSLKNRIEYSFNRDIAPAHQYFHSDRYGAVKYERKSAPGKTGAYTMTFGGILGILASAIFINKKR